jgi:hypothetical protein
MNMAISDNLFLAILSMDSYNRGYNAAIKLSGSEIGAATIGIADNSSAAQAASFFAQAYTWNGKTVISYRGTDQPGIDLLKGYWTGGGDILDAEAVMAIQFYESVAAQASSGDRRAIQSVRRCTRPRGARTRISQHAKPESASIFRRGLRRRRQFARSFT